MPIVAANREDQWLCKAITSAIKTEVDREVKLAVDDAKDRIERRVPEIVSGLMLRISKQISMKTMADELVVHVKLSGDI